MTENYGKCQGKGKDKFGSAAAQGGKGSFRSGGQQGDLFPLEKITEAFRLGHQRCSHMWEMRWKSILGIGNSMNNGKKQDISGCVLEITNNPVCWNTANAEASEKGRLEEWAGSKSGDCSHLRVFICD